MRAGSTGRSSLDSPTNPTAPGGAHGLLPAGGKASVPALLGGLGGGMSSLALSLVESDLCKSSMKGRFPEPCILVEGLLGG